MTFINYFLKNALTALAPAPKVENSIRVHIDDPLAVFKLCDTLQAAFKNISRPGNPLILCIGTDRSTGDSLGPLTGWRLSTLLHHTQIEVHGTIDKPVHAGNLEELLVQLESTGNKRPIVAIDACLGQLQNVGTVNLEQCPLKPGAGLQKHLPPVGDVSISGIVNVSGFMEYQVLQSTRLCLVFKMSQIIANSVYFAIKRSYLLRARELTVP